MHDKKPIPSPETHGLRVGGTVVVERSVKPGEPRHYEDGWVIDSFRVEDGHNGTYTTWVKCISRKQGKYKDVEVKKLVTDTNTTREITRLNEYIQTLGQKKPGEPELKLVGATNKDTRNDFQERLNTYVQDEFSKVEDIKSAQQIFKKVQEYLQGISSGEPDPRSVSHRFASISFEVDGTRHTFELLRGVSESGGDSYSLVPKAGENFIETWHLFFDNK